MGGSRQERLRRLPQVAQMLTHPALADAGPPWAVKEAVREVLARRREALLAGEEVDVAPDAVAAAAAARAAALTGPALRPVVNATGVVVHTNLGRSPLAPGAVERLAAVAGRYCNVEYDLARGARGGRGRGVEELLLRLTGAEAAVVVNNNAAAVLLSLRVLAGGREAVVSRGELVEIGGSFRIPDVMEASGAILREVGTTNRTHLRDYEDAISEDTALLMKVHRSNFRVSGFVAEVAGGELAELGRRRGVPVVEDLGSGQLVAGPAGDEPVVRDIVASGVDVVTFSGDKLLGGAQAGIVVGRAELVRRMARDPMMRALRVDKLIYAALEGTLRHVIDGEPERVPAYRMIHQGADEIRAAARRLRRRLLREVPPLAERAEVEVAPHVARAGGGAMAQVDLAGFAVRVRPRGGDAGAWAEGLRRAPVPVIARVADGCLWLDPRTMLPGDGRHVVAALAEVLA